MFLNMASEPTIVDNVTPDIPQLLHFLRFRRGVKGSYAHRYFLKQYIEPVFGKPDAHGNYVLVVGNGDENFIPRTAIMAHHDTVHCLDGEQKVEVEGKFAKLPVGSKSNCLGADCTTGVWLILHMIKNKVPNRYVIHAEEEIGMQGAKALIRDNPEWIGQTRKAISLDRYGTTSIITHQCGMRTASDDFARELDEALGYGFKLDAGGVFTDSEAYSDYVSECTNLSVGYYNQHTSREVQDLSFASELARKLVKTDWDHPLSYRDPSDYAFGDYDYFGGTGYKSSLSYESYIDDAADGYSNWGRKNNRFTFLPKEKKKDERTFTIYNDTTILEMVKEYPDLVADWLERMGMEEVDMANELGLAYGSYSKTLVSGATIRDQDKW